jgi:hypothetical protein
MADATRKKRGRRPKVEITATDAQLASAHCHNALKPVIGPLRTAADLVFGPAGPWLYSVYDQINERCWNGRLPHALLQLAITPHGGLCGLTKSPPEGRASTVTISPAIWNPRAWQLGGKAGWQHAVMVLLHEMLHVAEHQLFRGLPNPGETSHNRDVWVREANRISPIIGLPPICTRFVMRREGGKTSRKPLRPADDFPGLTQNHVGLWPYGMGQLVHADPTAWMADACKALGVPAPPDGVERCRV